VCSLFLRVGLKPDTSFRGVVLGLAVCFKPDASTDVSTYVVSGFSRTVRTEHDPSSGNLSV
jgi:hypothetical protein